MATIGLTNSRKFKSLDGLQQEAIDLFLLYCGIEECEAGHRFGPNRRGSSLIHVVTSGRGRLEMNGEVYTLGKDDAFYIPCGQTAYYQADDTDPWKYIWIGVSGVMATDTIREAGFSEKVPTRHLQEESVAKLAACTTQMLLAYQQTYANALLRTGELMQYFAILIEDYASCTIQKNSTHVPAQTYAQQAADYMKHHYHEKILVGELAGRIGINRCYLASGFMKVYKMSPKQYLMELRMTKAAALIKKGKEPIGDIARSVGYDDPLAFSKTFKQHFGMAPKQYRKSGQNVIFLKHKGEYWNPDE